uniref:Cadherin-like protein 26 n=1 Tax=Geotrypetes seraphini TaxID=260995 RepID=A0A6P8SIE0_GEOSA|nr:cadherin-like protein 26 [Geotrypetes seraphini]
MTGPTGLLLLLLLLLPIQYYSQSSGLWPLQRFKRRWILTTIVIEEEDSGPFPKLAGDLFNNHSQNKVIKYRINGQGVDEFPEPGLFSIDDAKGHVFVHRSIDREKTPMFVIHFDAVERASGKIVDRSLIFNIEVKDVNDNAPQFSSAEYNISVKETLSLINPIFQISAIDKDKEDTPNSEVVYSIISQFPSLYSATFNIDATHGWIHGKGCLDYETSKLITLHIKARDNGTPQMSSIAVVNIAVEDGNNHLPVFINETYIAQIHEGEVSSNILRINVEDKDTPQTPAWRAKYKILKGNKEGKLKITTDPKTNDGILSVIKPFDYESVFVQNLIISVENEEPFSSCEKGRMVNDPATVFRNVPVKVNVIDTNEPPIFKPGIQVIRQEGLQPGAVLAICNATDPDHAPVKIRYKVLQDPEGWVTIDEKTGVITSVKELDRESSYVNNGFYPIIVCAMDDGDPPQTGTGTVLLYITDINDNTPYLLLPHMEMCEHEENPFLTLKAADKDLDPFSGPFVFELIQKSSTWEIRKKTDDSAELLMLEKLPQGTYIVPLNIMDRQGASQNQNLHVRVCLCPDGITCETLAPPSHALGSGAMAAIFGSLLLLVLCLCFLMHCACGSTSPKHNGFIPFGEGNQTLIRYNEEGGISLVQASSSFISPSAQTRNGITKLNNQGGVRAPPPGYYVKENGHPISIYSRNSQFRKKSLDIFLERVGESIDQKVHSFNMLEHNVDTDTIQIYCYEGNLKKVGSLDTLSFTNSDTDLDFVAELDSKFFNLEEICQK